MQRYLYQIILAFTLGFFLPIQGQIVLNAPQPADNPNLPGNSPWTAICASASFNEFYAEVSWAGASANAGNTFYLELSDSNGDFSNPLELVSTTANNTTNPFTIAFSIPTDIKGNDYKMRVRSTDPVQTSPESQVYSMYYMGVTHNLNISENGDGVPPGTICASNPITLRVDNIANPETYRYIWYRSGTLLPSETSSTINVSQSGMYFALIDYGPICTGSGNTESNIIDVTIGGGGQNASTVSAPKTTLCAGEIVTLSSSITDPSNNYQWYKDGDLISGATSTTYNVNAASPGFEGGYAVEISATGLCSERSEELVITNADNFEIFLDPGTEMVLLPGESKNIVVSTSAVNPRYEWFMNGTSLGITTASITINQPGSYHAVITQDGGACPGTVQNSDTITVVSPTSFEFIIEYAGAYEACANSDLVMHLATINAVMNNGDKLDVTTDIASDFSYQWIKDGNSISGATSQNISLSNPQENGLYALEGVLSGFSTTSNALSVQLKSDENLQISSNGTVFCSGGDAIVLSTPTSLDGENFSWHKDGSPYNDTDTSLIVTEIGEYELIIQGTACPLTSNKIEIIQMDASVIKIDQGESIVFPEGGTVTVNASGGTSYRWINQDNVEVGTGSSLTLTEVGEYILFATIDNCEVSKSFTASYLESFNVPNVITPNGDGANDQWVIPNSYSNRPDVRVIIYDDKGSELLNQTEYKNNWPESTTSFLANNMVFYYVIKNESKTIKQGTITVIK